MFPDDGPPDFTNAEGTKFWSCRTSNGYAESKGLDGYTVWLAENDEW